MSMIFKIIGIIYLVVSLMGCSTVIVELSKESDAKIKLEVRQSFADFIEAMEALDSERYFALFDAEKFSGLSADGTIVNSIEELRAIMKPTFSMVENVSLEFTNVHVSVIDKNTAILVSEYEASVLMKDGNVIQDAVGSTIVWSKVSSSWKLVSISSSNKPGKSEG